MKTVQKRKKRILLKISGEALLGSKGYGIDPEFAKQIARELTQLSKSHEIAVTIGGGNIFRGTEAEEHGMDRASGDYAGMLATVINALVLQTAIEKAGGQSRVMTALSMTEVAEPYIRRRALRHLEKGRVVIFAAGTGNPFFTSDMAAALRALEIGAVTVYKATKVDGVYTADPVRHDHARRISKLSYDRVLSDNLTFMDASAVALLRDHSVPIVVFSIMDPKNLSKIIKNHSLGTVIS